MKTVVQALYWLTVALGNILDIVVMELISKNALNGFAQVYEFIIFAIIMLVDMIGLAFFTRNYLYKEERFQRKNSAYEITYWNIVYLGIQKRISRVIFYPNMI